MFRDAADEDYLVARIAARHSLHFQFCWSSQQALEKYLKAILLLNNEPIKGSHKLTDFINKACDISGDLLPYIICPPNSHPTSTNALFAHKPFEPVYEYIQRVEQYGDPNNRYRTFSIRVDGYDLNKLDQMVFLLRRVAFPLDMIVSGLGVTARSYLSEYRDVQLHPEMSFQKSIHKNGKDEIEESFRWRNFTFFEEQAIEGGTFFSGASAVNSEIFLAIQRGDKGKGSLKWLSENALPNKKLRNEIAEYL